MKTQYTTEVHYNAKNHSGRPPYPVTLRRVPGTKPVEIKRAQRAAKRENGV